MMNMIKPIIRIVKIKTIRVAINNAMSKTPEMDASNGLIAWVKPRGLLKDPSTYFRFGRNNPPPSSDSVIGEEVYGYDAMITIGLDIEIEDEIQTEEISGGLFAVVRTNLTNIGKMWEYLYNWVKQSKYTIADHGLEEVLGESDEKKPEKMLLDLWLPIKE